MNQLSDDAIKQIMTALDEEITKTARLTAALRESLTCMMCYQDDFSGVINSVSSLLIEVEGK